ncbi:MAG: hypothetical protein U5N85_16575 [Arcicella sp.]|nr:hypothetical protein [Arcicella sp.]
MIANEIAEQFKEKQLLKNEFLLKEGNLSNDYIFLLDGFMRSYTYDTEGNDITTNFIQKTK